MYVYVSVLNTDVSNTNIYLHLVQKIFVSVNITLVHFWLTCRIYSYILHLVVYYIFLIVNIHTYEVDMLFYFDFDLVDFESYIIYRKRMSDMNKETCNLQSQKHKKVWY
jgi:hypothetical protein